MTKTDTMADVQHTEENSNLRSVWHRGGERTTDEAKTNDDVETSD